VQAIDFLRKGSYAPEYNNGYETNGQIAHAIILVFAL
jgi:hypothetical protein